MIFFIQIYNKQLIVSVNTNVNNGINAHVIKMYLYVLDCSVCARSFATTTPVAYGIESGPPDAIAIILCIFSGGNSYILIQSRKVSNRICRLVNKDPVSAAMIFTAIMLETISLSTNEYNLSVSHMKEFMDFTRFPYPIISDVIISVFKSL